MKAAFALIFSLIVCGSVLAQISELDTLDYFNYTATYEKAEYINDSESMGHWAFTFRSGDGSLFTFDHYSFGFENNLLQNKGLKKTDDYAVNTGKKFIIHYIELVEYIWEDEDEYWDNDWYEYDYQLQYYSGTYTEFSE